MAIRNSLQCNTADVTLYKVFGELREEMHVGFEKMYRLLLQVALGAIMVNIAMVTAIFVIAKYLV